MQKFFPEVKLEELRRPEKIDLLISHHEGRLAPQRVKVVGDLVLWESPLGMRVGGAHPDLFEEVEVQHMSPKKTHTMRTAAVKYEESGGDGTASEQPVSQSVEDVAVETANQEERK